MNTDAEKGKGTFAAVIAVILTLSLVIMSFSIIVGLFKGYKGDRQARESDLYGMTRGQYEEIAGIYQRKMFSEGKPSKEVSKGLAVGEYYHVAVIKGAHDKMGDDSRSQERLEILKSCKDRMGDYDVIADRIDIAIEEALNKAGEYK